MARVYSLIVGSCRHPGCMAIKGGGWRARSFPSRAYLIEAASGELLLFDTGYAPRFFEAVSHGWGRIYGWLTPAELNPEALLTAQLSRMGVAPGDINKVVISHWHADHMAGLDDFRHLEVFCSAAGWNSVRHLHGLAALRRGFLPELLPSCLDEQLHFVEWLRQVPLPPRLHPFKRGWQLLPNELILVPLPGHAHGQIGAFVATSRGWVLLAGDAAWSDASVLQMRGPSELSFLLQPDRRAYYATLADLHKLALSGGATIALSHAEASRAEPEEL
ncbi:MBL fold metallo-hydrolase [Rugamonas aquatica]|uniref:MBL fold metallo-hydrolase n=1 Tax=Rugamonas aquatica TaxID=2743357 RepID=A0A6A7N6S4_9BURK|nr:MBL fold metallo-hydrolase [Rugamonas aquatica]MQA40621.1 MBL fold metallo-hydrolase [Rugamonas aquatica]